jgi:hypothetical protein
MTYQQHLRHQQHCQLAHLWAGQHLQLPQRSSNSRVKVV